MNKRTFQAAAAVLAVLAAAGTARATSVEPCNLAEICHRAEKIFYGECVGARRTVVAIRTVEVPAMEYDFQVVDGVRGAAAGEIATFRHYGQPTFDPETRQRSEVPPSVTGMPEYRVGDRYMVYLNPENEFGLTTPAGLYQGAFAEAPAPDGRPGFVNGMGNATLFHGVKTEERSNTLSASYAGGRATLEHQNIELDARERYAISNPGRGAVDREVLFSLTRKLAASEGRVVELPAAGDELPQPAQP